MTGALIMTFVADPVLGLALAFLSHPFLDMLPHYGVEPSNLLAFLPGFLADVAIASSVLLALLLVQPPEYLWLVLGGVLAASPDLLSIPHFVDSLLHRPYRPGPVRRFLSWIQWSQTVPGVVVEALWFFGGGLLLLSRI